MKLLLIFTLFSSAAVAQNIEISGTVKDADSTDEPLIGASVVVKYDGKTVGTITDIDGRFKLVADKRGELVVSYIGYNDFKTSVNGKTSFQILLGSSSEKLDEVVVVAYGTQKKVTVTGALSSVSAKELMRSPAASLGNALTGKIPGVQTVQYSGRPGADDPQIFIRGVNTLSASGAQPLVLVDGVERSFTQIDPNEVADITVLKDASATAVFGVRGANGVILVTTRRGEEGKTSIEASAAYSIQTPTKFLQFADSYTYANMYNYAQKTDGATDLRFSDEVIEHFRLQDMPLIYPSIDWMTYIMKDYAPQQQYNINLSGGTKKAKFFASVGVLSQGGLFDTFSSDKNTTFKYDRYNYRVNMDLDLDDYNSLSVNVGGRIEEVNDIGLGEDEMFRYLMDAAPFAGAGIVDGKRIVANEEYVGKTMGDALSRYYGQGYRKNTKNVLNLDLMYKLNLSFLTKGLDLRLKGSYNSDYTHQKSFKAGQPTYKPIIQEDGSIGLQRQGDTWPLSFNGESSWYSRNWYAEASFNYSAKFGDHTVTGLLLYNQSKSYYPKTYPDIPTGYVGLVGRVTYNYQTKYLLDLNAGYNGSENFAPGHRYGFFPSVSLGWIVSAEKFMQNQNVISYLKLRASYGLVGNDRMGDNRFLYLPGTYAFADNAYLFGTTNSTSLKGAYEASAGNPLVSWETSAKQNYGFDLKLFKDKFSINVDIYKENRKDILIDNSSLLAAPAAQKPISLNYGRVNSWGYEIQLNWTQSTSDFYYSIAPSISYSKNTIKEMAEVPQNHPWLYKTGNKVNQPFGYEFFELYEPGETEKRYEDKYGIVMPKQIIDNANLKRGDAVYVDLDGDGKIDTDDKKAIGYPDYPEYTANLNLYFKFKGFDFSMTWNASINCSRYLGGVYRPQFGEQKIGPLLTWVAENSWTETNPDAALPRISFTNEGQNAADSKLWLVDTSYARLKNLEIGYNFDKLPVKIIKNLRIYANGSNLLTFSKFKGNDPENKGGSYQNWIKYPLMKVYNLGLRVTF